MQLWKAWSQFFRFANLTELFGPNLYVICNKSLERSSNSVWIIDTPVWSQMQMTRKADHLVCEKHEYKTVNVNLFPKLLDRPHPRNQIRLISTYAAHSSSRKTAFRLCSRFVYKTSPDRITNYSQRWAQSTGLSIIYLSHEPLTMRNDPRSRRCYTALIDTFTRSIW